MHGVYTCYCFVREYSTATATQTKSTIYCKQGIVLLYACTLWILTPLELTLFTMLKCHAQGRDSTEMEDNLEQHIALCGKPKKSE